MRVSSLAILLVAASLPASAESIKIGVLKVGSSGSIYLAQDKGYFAAEGLQTTLVNFESGAAVAVAVVGGDVDVGVTGLTGGLYNMAAKGEMRVIGGLHRETPGFHELGFFASRQAYDGGLRSLKDLAGHSIAVTTVGSTTHYDIGLIAAKYHFPLESVRVLPLQTISAQVAAVMGGQADAGVLPSTSSKELADHGVHLLGWVGDQTPWQIGAIFVATKTADGRQAMLEHFLAALQKGARDYYAAFTGPGQVRKDGPTAPEALAIIGKYLGQPPERIENELSYVDPELRIDIKDVGHQIAWYKAEGMVHGDVTAAALVDRRYARPLP